MKLLHIKNRYFIIFIVRKISMILVSKKTFSLKNIKIIKPKVTKILQIWLQKVLWIWPQARKYNVRSNDVTVLLKLKICDRHFFVFVLTKPYNDCRLLSQTSEDNLFPPVFTNEILNSNFYSVFQRFRQTKFYNGGSVLSSSKFMLLPMLPQKMKLALKVVKMKF